MAAEAANGATLLPDLLAPKATTAAAMNMMQLSLERAAQAFELQGQQQKTVRMQLGG
jgi:hypothetical protein